MNQLLRDGRDCHQRIKELGVGIRKFRKAMLTEWLNQAERLWIAAEHHGLKGKHFSVFTMQIGIDRTSAHELLKLHPHRKEVLARCQQKNDWPGWGVCAGWYKPDGQAEPSEAPTTRNKWLPTPTWQRWKVK